MSEKSIAVFFPGIGYTVDKPLLYYSRKLAREEGYEVKLVPYSGFPEKVKGDAGRVRQSYEIALKQAQEMQEIIDFADYDRVLFVGKSIGTVVALQIASESGCFGKIRKVLYTPVEQAFAFDLPNAVAFAGTADPWVGGADSRIPQLCEEKRIACHVYEGANHSLETGNTQADLEYLADVMNKTRDFIKAEGE